MRGIPGSPDLEQVILPDVHPDKTRAMFLGNFRQPSWTGLCLHLTLKVGLLEVSGFKHEDPE